MLSAEMLTCKRESDNGNGDVGPEKTGNKSLHYMGE